MEERHVRNNYLRVRVRGKGKNTEAVGTRIYARVGAAEQMREIMVGSSFISQNPTNIVIFGLGTAGNIDELRFQWPDGTANKASGRRRTRRSKPLSGKLKLERW